MIQAVEVSTGLSFPFNAFISVLMLVEAGYTATSPEFTYKIIRCLMLRFTLMPGLLTKIDVMP
jgi:hypothetical protein